jgi:hypothetical protein
MGKQKRKAGAQGGDGEWVESRDRRRNDRLIKQQFRKNRQRVQYGVCVINLNSNNHFIEIQIQIKISKLIFQFSDRYFYG